MNRLALMIAVGMCLHQTVEVSAQEPTFADYYADGLGEYANGNYDTALQKFYRAWALESSANLLRLIIRTHDFMGHCSAADRHVNLFEEIYPREHSPSLQRCDSAGHIHIRCSPLGGAALVEGQFQIACGESVKVPAGQRVIKSLVSGQTVTTTVTAGGSTTVELRHMPEEILPVHTRLQEEIHSSGDEPAYTAVQSIDGLYQIWVRSDLRKDPDLDERSGPAFVIIRRSDDLYDITYPGDGEKGFRPRLFPLD